MAKNLFPNPCVEWEPSIYLSKLDRVSCKWRDILRLSLEDQPELGLNRITGAIFSGPSGNGQHVTAEALAGTLQNLGFIYTLRTSGCTLDCEDVSDACAVLNAVFDIIRRGGKVCLLLESPERSRHSYAIQEYLVRILENYGNELFLIIITEDPAKITTGLQRRLSIFPCTAPTLTERQDWLEDALYSPVTIKIDGMDKWALARETDGFSWRQMQNLWIQMRRKILEKYILDVGRYNPERLDEEVSLIWSQGRVHLAKSEVMDLIDGIRTQTAAPVQMPVQAVAVPAVVSAAAPVSTAVPAHTPAPVKDDNAEKIDHSHPENLSVDDLLDIDF